LTACLPSLGHAHEATADVDAVRAYYLDPLIHPHEYAPGKNSFLLQNLHGGDRKTVLELTGSGSIRHIWSTWSVPGDDSGIPAPGCAVVRVYVDGETQPSIAGPFDELCKAALASGNRYMPVPAFNYKGAFNFYLPIYFERGIRVEIEAARDIQEFYTQIDYRTEDVPQPAARLVSENEGAELRLRYLHEVVDWKATLASKRHLLRAASLLKFGENPGELTIAGPGILRALRLAGASLSDLEMEIYWDDESSASVRAPLRYFFADFTNAALDSRAGESTCFFPMPFRKRAHIIVRSLSGAAGEVRVDYSFEPGELPAGTLYFHALYHQTEKTSGYEQYPVLDVRGAGLFVGMNLFDSGHNHGGGDAALIDAGTAAPKVLHGICGEDYFGFAWHHTGTMTPLTGAPAHDRRYRLHLENPYPFHESSQFLFGVFAGQRPKSVAFWYQLPVVPSDGKWRTFDVPWKVLGPVAVEKTLPDSVSSASYEALVPLDRPTPVSVSWQDARMHSGFLDTTYHFRHYTLAERGIGYVAGASKTQLVTYAYSPARQMVNVIVGHDDLVLFQVNGEGPIELPEHNGFEGDALTMNLHPGWNKLVAIVFNGENVNWRWYGLSLAFDREQGSSLRFATRPD